MYPVTVLPYPVDFCLFFLFFNVRQKMSRSVQSFSNFQIPVAVPVSNNSVADLHGFFLFLNFPLYFYWCVVLVQILRRIAFVAQWLHRAFLEIDALFSPY
jgi:hypothetical protein